MLKNFWIQWMIATVIAITLSVAVAVISGQWFFGLLSYFVFGMVKDSVLLTLHIKRPVDNNSEIK
jgi:hypothetical protein